MTLNPKCSSCKCYWIPDGSDVKSSGLQFKTCRKCREYKSKYFEKNIEKFNENIMCECGCTYYKRHYRRHCMSETHQNYISSI